MPALQRRSALKCAPPLANPANTYQSLPIWCPNSALAEDRSRPAAAVSRPAARGQLRPGCGSRREAGVSTHGQGAEWPPPPAPQDRQTGLAPRRVRYNESLHRARYAPSTAGA